MHTDQGGRIVFVNDAWDRFALENSGRRLVCEKVMGTLLWDHISDSTTLQVYRVLLEKCIETGELREVDFRCDSPEKERHLKMRIQKLEDGRMMFHSRVLREVPRERIDLLDAGLARTSEFIRMCSWCKDILVDGQWLPAAEAVNRLGLFEEQGLPGLTHGICPACSEKLLNEVDD